MAPPSASRNFKQEQPITTTLRTICQSYPASTCLRELLQNADDAQATEIEYVLDTNSYNDGPLMYEELAEYHGPALLARNNRVFRDQDFASLSSVGDSGKRHDPAATGKFGLGFNSVYHWTDGPWVYSRKWLLMLDPHNSWSKRTEEPQGPTWDVVTNAANEELQNHMKTFSAFHIDHRQDFDQTIIRIPLRTQRLSERSKIVNQATSPEEVKRELNRFCEDLKGGSILFLKHIRKVIVRVDDTMIATVQMAGKGPEDDNSLQELPLDFRRLYSPEASTNVTDIAKSFHVTVQYATESETWADKYVVQHAMTPTSGDVGLDQWARELKLFPWVAIAAPLSVKGPFMGTLFSTLSLHVPTQQPVHIHGLFAIAPDRARLGYDDEAKMWNEFLFKDVLSPAWTGLLKEVEGNAAANTLWPCTDISHKKIDLWTLLDDWVIDEILLQKAAVWNTVNCAYIDHRQALFTTEGQEKYTSAISKVGLPAVILKASLYQKVKERAAICKETLRMLRPPSVRAFLRNNKKDVPLDAAPLILEYCLLDAVRGDVQGSARKSLCEEIEGLEIWPTCDNRLTISAGDLLLPRDDTEAKLFSISRHSITLDLDRVTPQVRKLFWHDIKSFDRIIRFRTLLDLAEDWPKLYTTDTRNPDSNGFVRRVSSQDSVLRDIWIWICSRHDEGENAFPSSMDTLWLIPINGSRVRRLGPSQPTIPTFVVQESEQLASCIKAIAAQEEQDVPPILDADILGAKTTAFLKKKAETVPTLRLAHENDLVASLSWLLAAKRPLARLSRQHKTNLLKHLEGLVRAQYSVMEKHLVEDLVRELPLFSRSVSVEPYTQRTIESCALGRDEVQLLPKRLPALPAIPGISFYDPSTESENYLLETLGLLQKPDHEHLLKFFLPWIVSADESSLLPTKEALIDWIFDNSLSRFHSPSWLASVKTHPIVPVLLHGGTKSFRCLKDLVDPKSIYAPLYFPEENVFPQSTFYERHSSALRACQISKGADSTEAILGRVRYYGRRYSEQAPDEGLVEKVKILLETTIERNLPKETVQEIQSSKWLPTKRVSDGKLELRAPAYCRGVDQSQLVDKVLGVTPFLATENWKRCLGWDQDVPKALLFRQLDCCLENHDAGRVDVVLEHIKLEDVPELALKKCILGRMGEYLLPQNAFRPSDILQMFPLSPHIDQVASSFFQKHSDLVAALKVKDFPSVEDLQSAQDSLPTSEKGQLDEFSRKLAVSILEVATHLGYDSINFKVPDTKAILRRLPDIVHGDRSATGMGEFNFTHSEVPESLVKRLEIETSYERATQLQIEFEDEDEDEYTPRESLTNIIRDTLGRYNIESAFNEWLANADDALAGQVSFTIDECKNGHHGSQSLLTSELAPLQGAALMVFNDGVFNKKDFSGFKEIGQGGKTEDPLTTGMFGRGALAMYHFTDVPMLISGDQFLILDPQQERLPRNKSWKKKVGVKMPLSRLRDRAPDHLAPFHGLHGYDMEQDTFNGTIWRFPFRPPGYGSNLKQDARSVDHLLARTLLVKYWDTARVSLLFLQNVQSIDFYMRGQQVSEWSVSAEKPQTSSDEVFNTITIKTSRKGEDSGNEVWRVGVMDIDQSPGNVPKVGKGRAKISECGLAAQLSSPTPGPISRAIGRGDDIGVLGKSSRVSNQHFFCRLPTGSTAQLPVSVQASFAITGDRKTIAFEGQDSVAKWNHWLLTVPIPNFYVEFLKDLALRLGEDAFKFWPSIPKVSGPQTLSSLLARAFWSKVMDHEHRFDQLYPLAPRLEPDATDLRPPNRKSTRKLHHVTTIENAHFDLLTNTESSKFRPFLQRLNLNIVRPQSRIRKAFEDAAENVQITSLDSTFFCTLFKEEDNCKVLDDFLSSLPDDTARAQFLALFYEIVIPKVNKDPESLKILKGCRILPRPDLGLPLGLVSLDPLDGGILHFRAELLDQKLFSFAANRMVNTALMEECKALEHIVNGPFGIHGLELDHFGSLLSLPDAPTQESSRMSRRERGEWIGKFWARANIKFLAASIIPPRASNNASMTTTMDLIVRANLWDQSVFRVVGTQQEQYISPRLFSGGSFIVDPSRETQCKLCLEIGGLKRIDPTCVPHLLAESEKNLDKHESFLRFMTALERISQPRGVSMKGYLQDALTSKSKETLCSLLTGFLINYNQSQIIPHLETLRKLPVWPLINRPDYINVTSHIAAEDARYCHHSKMFMPWIRDLSEFVDPGVTSREHSSLEKLRVFPMSAEQFWDHIKADLPGFIANDGARKAYCSLIQELASHGIRTGVAIALDGSGQLQKANTMFDHDDEIFKAAFRHQTKVRFLHPDVRHLRSYWRSIGLRSRSNGSTMSSEDFLKCGWAVDKLWKDAGNAKKADYEEAASKVSKYLIFGGQDIRQWLPSTWKQISEMRIWKIKTSADQLSFRQHRMEEIANGDEHCTLLESGRYSDMRLSWSRVRYLESPPLPYVFDQLPRRGRPSIPEVFLHLNFLVNLRQSISQAETAEYLHDVQACYDFLQVDTNQTALLPDIRNAKVWFNLHTTQTEVIPQSSLEISLLPAKNLCLNLPADIKHLKVAKNFLVPYEKLLSALGCKSQKKVHPSRTTTRSSNARSIPMAKALLKMREFKDQGQLTDVIFEAEGQQKHANKNFLAASSEYCDAQFRREWGQITKQQSVIKILDMTFKTLSAVVDFAYTEVFVAPELREDSDIDTIAETLDELLDLLVGADRWSMQDLHQQVEDFLLADSDSQTYVRLDNVSGVEKRASEAQAKRLATYCRDFAAANAGLVKDYEALEGDE